MQWAAGVTEGRARAAEGEPWGNLAGMDRWILKPRDSVHWYGEILAWLKRWL